MRRAVQSFSDQRKLFRGWWVVAVLFLGGFMMYGAGLYSFVLFVTPLSKEFDWSRAATGGLVSAFWISAPLALFAGPLLQRFGIKRTALAGIVIEALCLMALVFASQLWQMYLLRALAGLGKVLYAITLPVTLSKWFSKHFGIAVAVMYAGWHIGGLVLAPLTGGLIEHLGWRTTSFVLGAALLLIALIPTYWALRVPSADSIGLPLDGIDKPSPAPDPLVEAKSTEPSNHRDVVRTLLAQRSFQFIMVATALYFVTYGGVLAHQAAVVEDAGISSRIASILLGSTAGFAALGALFTGWLIDRWPLIYTTIVQYSLMAAGVICLLLIMHTPSVGLLSVHALTFGVAVGGSEVYWITLLRRRLGDGNFTQSWGIYYFIELAVLVIAPIGAGLLYDLTGNYTVTLASELALLAVPFCLSLLVVTRNRFTSIPTPVGRA